MLIRRVVDDELGDDTDISTMGLVDEAIEIRESAVGGMDILVIGNVIPIVAQRRWIERQQPQRIDAERLEIVQLLGHPAEISYAIVVGVEKCTDVRLIDDCVLI